MIAETSFLTYFQNAGIVVKSVMFILTLASVFSWTYIFQRSFYLKDIKNASHDFEEKFWAGGDLTKLYQDSTANKENLVGAEAIFYAGFKEYLRLSKHAASSAEATVESVKRAMRGAEMREQEKMEATLPLLATVGSTSPYLGLFGTVWGIMLSFKSLAQVQQATIAMVAPGLAEALIATAMGLFAAIPAVIAYNRFSAEMNRLLNRFDIFQDEFANIIFRQAQSQQTTKSERSLMAES